MQPPKFGVIAAVTTPHTNCLIEAMERGLAAHSYEICLDRFCGDTTAMHAAMAVITKSYFGTKPVIFSLRMEDQGGQTKMSLKDQFAFWSNTPEPFRQRMYTPEVDADFYVDFNLGLVNYIWEQRLPTPFPWSRIGCSVQVPNGMPVSCCDLIDDLQGTPTSAFLRFAARAKSYKDVLLVESVLTRNDPRPLIAYPMGKEGLTKRKHCLLCGSAGVTAYIPGYQPSEEDQPTINELLNDPFIQKGLVGNMK